MDNNLIIFIDSLPYYYLDKIPNMSGYPRKNKVISGLGYSINIHAELFGGYVPDEVGFFNEWTYDPGSAPLRKLALIKPVLERIKRESLSYRIVKKCICTMLNIRSFDICPDYLCSFSRDGKEIYSVKSSGRGTKGAYSFSFPMPTIFNTAKEITTVLPEISAKKGGSRDYSVYLQARELINKSRNLFLWFPDLDGIAHVNGVGSDKYHKHVLTLDEWIEKLKKLFLEKYTDGNILIFSDHGMVNIHKEIDLNLEENIAKPGEKTYHYFTDSTMLRVWILNKGLKPVISEYLTSLNAGKILDDRYRKEKGITAKKFGDIIYVLNEGCVFHPVTLSSGKSGAVKAMHGYLPELESQAGICLSPSKNYGFPYPEVSTFDIYNYLTNSLSH